MSASGRARTLMVQGTASSVGKSLLVTALCRIYARRGYRVAPFKAQNMSLNAAVTPEGHEVGRAQYAQAEAARVVPHVDMNPILLKPETAATSQVIVMGRAAGSLHFGDYDRRKPDLRAVVRGALDRLRARHDLVIIEGAGSPAEVNLKAGDLVNMWVAEQAEAPVILVADIERGGALAAIVGTLELLEPEERGRVRALVINKFRGDVRLFADGVAFLERRTGVRVAGVVPHLGDAGVASEDSLDLQPQRAGAMRGAPGIGPRIAVVKLPHLSNFDEFEPLLREAGVEVVFCEAPAALRGAALVILPGTKCTAEDLAWLRATGLAGEIAKRAAENGPVLGICGGFQMLGERLLDPEGIESPEPDVPGLGLLPVVTRFQREKATAAVELRLAEGLPLLEQAGGRRVSGYEIHCGRVELLAGARPFGAVVRRNGGSREGLDGAIAAGAPVAGTLVHGLFEDATVRTALLRALGAESVQVPGDPYDALADHVERALDMKLLDALAGVERATVP